MTMTNKTDINKSERDPRGGFRPGAGRKSLPGQVYRVRLTHGELLEHLSRVPDAASEIAMLATKCFTEGQDPH